MNNSENSGPKTLSVSYQELRVLAKELCESIEHAKYYARVGTPLECLPSRDEYIRVYNAFLNNNPHDITKIIVHLVKEMKKPGFLESDSSRSSRALNLLDCAMKSPLVKEKYGTLFNHKTCLEKLQTCKSKLLQHIEKQKKLEELRKIIY